MDDLKNLKILIVDDEELIRDVFVETLELYGAKCSEASNGNEAFEKIQKENFDFVISDVRMPECSGIKLLENMHSQTTKMPQIIMMSGFSDLTNDRAKELGAIGLFMKPTKMNSLIETIKGCM